MSNKIIVVLFVTLSLIYSYSFAYSNTTVSFDCQSGYVCRFKVIYIDQGSWQKKQWISPDFSLGYSKIFSKPNATIVQVRAHALASWNAENDDFKIFNLTIRPGNTYNGKMWGSIFSPQACLTLNGSSCL